MTLGFRMTKKQEKVIRERIKFLDSLIAGGFINDEVLQEYEKLRKQLYFNK